MSDEEDRKRVEILALQAAADLADRLRKFEEDWPEFHIADSSGSHWVSGRLGLTCPGQTGWLVYVSTSAANEQCLCNQWWDTEWYRHAAEVSKARVP